MGRDGCISRIECSCWQGICIIRHRWGIDSFVQDCRNLSGALAMELPPFCAEPFICIQCNTLTKLIRLPSLGNQEIKFVLSEW